MKTITSCGNPVDFEAVILKHLSDDNAADFRVRLYEIARALCSSWSAAGVRQLLSAAKNDIVAPELRFMVNKDRRALSDTALEIIHMICAA